VPILGKSATAVGSIMTEPIYLTPAEVAAILRVHPRTVLRLAQQDATMPATRVGAKLVRFEKAALERWLARKRPRLAQRSTQEVGHVAAADRWSAWFHRSEERRDEDLGRRRATRGRSPEPRGDAGDHRAVGSGSSRRESIPSEKPEKGPDHPHGPQPGPKRGGETA